MEHAFWGYLEKRASENGMTWQDYLRYLVEDIYDAPNRSAALKSKLLDFLIEERTKGVRGIPSRWRIETKTRVTHATAYGSRLIMGRREGVDMVIRDDELSRKHLMLAHDGESWWAIDLGSKNGIQVNGKKVVAAKIQLGDEILAGTTTIILRENRSL